MRKRKKLLILPVLSVISLICLIYLVFAFSPNTTVSFSSLKITAIPIGFLLLFIFLWTTVWFIFANKIQGLLLATFSLIYLILRLNNLNQTFFLVLLFILFAATELFFFRKH
ncbi:MAG: hypothetical protein HY344_00425 [Candidatus Levybacteria bacterium]|nr:hypothetical protein [Candidatus Levybacteria bacterium]